ncbi:MAG: hypothetical protein ACE5IC_05100 [Candidatus Brocadiales bacterium]
MRHIIFILIIVLDAQAMLSFICVSPILAREGLSLIEGEALVQTAGTTEGRIFKQSMTKFGHSWSGNAQLFWTATRVAARQFLIVNVPRGGIYSIAGYFTKAPDYGILQLWYFHEGQPRKFGQPFNGYASRVMHSGKVPLGTASLQAGANLLMVQIVGKDARSKGHFVGVDALELAPMGLQLPEGRPMTGSVGIPLEERGIIIKRPSDTVGLNPQPEPPSREGKQPSDMEKLNPQPEPPAPADLFKLNPQPEPP